MKRSLSLGLGFLVGALSLATAAEKPLVIDTAQSRIEVDVKVTIDSFVGSLPNYDAVIVVDDATMTVKSASFAFKFADVKTGKEKRDSKMLEWQENEKYPDARFELMKLTGKSGGSYIAVGKFTFHGQTQTINFPVQISTEGSLMVIDGEAVVDTEQYGLPIIRMFFAKVNPLVTVRFHLQGKVPAGE